MKIDLTKKELEEIMCLIDKEIIKSYDELLYKIRDKIEKVIEVKNETNKKIST